MGATSVWFGNEKWPSGRSPGDFAKDVFRLENAQTDREKAFAFYTWIQRCMNRGPNIYTPSSGGYARCFDPLTIFAWGSHECTGWGWVAAEALNAAGLKARRMASNENGHTYYEVFYKGVNGKAEWHAFDPFLGWYFIKEDGEVASCADIAANPGLVHDPLPGGPEKLGNDWMNIKLSRRAAVHDWVDIVQPVQNEQLSFDLVQGQSVSCLWRPPTPGHALVTYGDQPAGERSGHHRNGSHCDIAPYDYEGRLRYPEHEPYWDNYRWPDSRDHNRMVRYLGCGYLKWTPLQYGEEACEYASNAVFKDNGVGPTGANVYMEAAWKIRLPYLAAHITLDTYTRGSGEIGFSISSDNGRTFWNLKRGNAPMGGMISNGRAQYEAGSASVQGLKEFILRADMMTYTPQDNFMLDTLRILVAFQNNMNILPRLLPGENQLYLDVPELGDGEKCSVRWNYETDAGQQETALATDKPGRVEETVTIDADDPRYILMHGVTVKVE